MLDNKKIGLMARIAIYEKTGAKEDLEITGYFKKDYASLHTVFTFLWITVGYALAAGLALLCNLNSIIEDLSVSRIVMIAAVIIGIYLALAVLYCICANIYYRVRHNKAKKRVKKYYRELARLDKMGMKEIK